MVKSPPFTCITDDKMGQDIDHGGTTITLMFDPLPSYGHSNHVITVVIVLFHIHSESFEDVFPFLLLLTDSF